MELMQFVDNLNLNSYEKEIIIFLASIDSSDANNIYKNTKVPKGRIYSVLNSLVEKRFVNIIPTNPKKYKIDNIKNALKEYLELKKTEINQSIDEVEKVTFKPKSFYLEKNAPSVYTFTGREEHLNALISLRNRARKRLIQVAPIFKGTFASNMSLYKALNRGVDVRILVRKVTDENKKNIKECIKLGAKIKYLDSDELVYFLLKDYDEFILGLESYENKEERLSLISRNKALLVALEKYFDELWKKGKEV